MAEQTDFVTVAPWRIEETLVVVVLVAWTVGGAVVVAQVDSVLYWEQALDYFDNNLQTLFAAPIKKKNVVFHRVVCGQIYFYILPLQ